MTEQRLLSLLRQAVQAYDMIESGDRIAVGVSGGKDSMALLYGMTKLAGFYPEPFSVCAVCVDLGYEGAEFSRLEEFCHMLGVELEIVSTRIGQIVMEEKKESHPCSLCSRMRKGALVQAALGMNCNKIAYAHHKDDFIETMLMSLIYQGRFYAFPPVTWFEDTGLRVIRPLMLAEERQVQSFCRKYSIPVIPSLCPVDGTTARAYAKDLMNRICRDHPKARDRMFRALTEGKIEDWPERSDGQK